MFTSASEQVNKPAHIVQRAPSSAAAAVADAGVPTGWPVLLRRRTEGAHMENHLALCTGLCRRLYREYIFSVVTENALHISFFFFLSFSLFFFLRKCFLPSMWTYCTRNYAYMFIEHKHREHLVSDNDTVAKQIKNMISKVQREVMCQRWHRPSETRVRSSEVWFNTWTIKICISLHYIIYQKLVFR